MRAEEEAAAAATTSGTAAAAASAAAPAPTGRSMSALLAARSSEAANASSSRCGLAAALGQSSNSDPSSIKLRNARRVRDTPLPALDAADAADPLAASEYAGDIFAYYARAEPRFRPPADYMARQVDVNEKMRAILLDWLVEVHLKFKLLPETLHLTGSLIDRYLASNPVSRKNLQLVGVTAMLVASKYEEIWAPEVRDFVYISDRAYSRDQILACEKALLNALGFQLTVPTAHAFAGRFMKVAAFEDAACAEVSAAAGGAGNGGGGIGSSSSAAAAQHVSSRTAPSRQMRHYVSYLVELALPEYSMLAHSPSELAAGAVVAARRALGASPEFPRPLERASGVSPAVAEAAASALCVLAAAAPAVTLQAVYKKYCGAKFGEVARLVQPPAPTVL